MDQQQLPTMKVTVFVIVFALCQINLLGQDLLAELDKTSPASKDYTIATFKGTRLVNFHTIETLSKGTMEVRIAHRFGSFSTSSTNLWGLDGPATIQLRIDYAVSDRLMIGLGRASDHKMIDGFMKYRLLRQTTDNSMPISITTLASVNIDSEPNSLLGVDYYHYFSSRLAYMGTAMIARKFNSKVSLQISPVFIHYNIVQNLTDKNDMFSLVYSTRYKFTKRMAMILEYAQRITPYSANMSQYYNVLGVGLDVETGGHVFQVFVTNGYSINETRTIPYTTTNVGKGLMLGFNLSRVFSTTSK
ncbi:MAG TPA: hypothetical protein DGG95_15590 [Cytophagales bacterium]|jgi:hypothetical protein|nr:hypothetical protein [Cytophagales bacterium]